MKKLFSHRGTETQRHGENHPAAMVSGILPRLGPARSGAVKPFPASLVLRAALLSLLLSWPLPNMQAASYPDRPGRKMVEKLCGNCHGLKLMEPMRRTRAQWQTSVDDMLTRGMKAEESEMEEVVNYLAKYLSRLNVNKATAAELQDVLELTQEQAQALVDYRGRNGPLKNFDALEKVPGLDAKLLAAQRDRIAFTSAAF